MYNRLFGITTPSALGSFSYFNSFKKYAYSAIFYFNLVELQCIELVCLTKDKINLQFEGKEIKAALLYFAFFNYLTIQQ